MKKLFLLLLAIIALAAPVRATDVSVAANEIPNFNPSGIGSDVTITIAVNNGSPTITSSGQFRTNWIGLGGFQITIAGVRYTIANVTSANSATLTTNYAGSSSASIPATWHKYSELRFYVDRPFRPLGKDYIVQSGGPGSGAWYKRVAASVINVAGVNTLFIPSLTLDATTDSTTDNTASYSAGFYRPGGAEIQPYDCFRSFSLPPVTPTNWADICVFNSSPIIARNVNAYTQDQINARLPSCAANQLIYFATTGQAQSCLPLGPGLSISGGALTASGGGGGGTISGTIAADQIAFGVGPNTIGGVADFTRNPVGNTVTLTGASSVFTVTNGATPATFASLNASGILAAQKTSATASDAALVDLVRVRAAADYPDSGDTLATIQVRSSNNSNSVSAGAVSFIATQSHSASLAGTGMIFNTSADGSITPITRMLINRAGTIFVAPGSQTVTTTVTGAFLVVGQPTSGSTGGTTLANPASIDNRILAIQGVASQVNTYLTLMNSSGQALIDFMPASNQIELRFQEDPANGSSYVSLRSPASLAANIPLTLPPTLPASGNECLQISDAGAITRTGSACGAGGGGIGGSIALNQVAVGSGSNTIAGSSAFTFASNSLQVVSASGVIGVTDGGTPETFASKSPGVMNIQKTSTTPTDVAALGLTRVRGSSDYPDSGDNLAKFTILSSNGASPIAPATMLWTATQSHSGSLGGVGFELATAANGSITAINRILINQLGVVALGPDTATITTSFDSGAVAAIGGLLRQYVVSGNVLHTRYREDPANGTNYVALKPAASIASNIEITLFDQLPGGTQCVQLSSTGVLSTTGSACGAGGGGGYTTVQEEGSNLTQRATLNFIGSSFTAADDAGNSRTNVTADTDLDALASNSTNGYWARTGAGTGSARTFQAGAGISVTNGDGVSGNTTYTWAPDTQVNNFTIFNSANASRTITIGLSGATDPVWSFSDGVANLSTGTLQQGGVDVVTTTGTQTLTNKTLTSPRIGTAILDANGNELLVLTGVASAVNELTISNNSTGNDPFIAASGGDSNSQIILLPKGNGSLIVGQTNTGTNAVARSFGILVNSTGTPAAGFGQSWDFYLESNSANDRLASQIITRWTTATDASRTAGLDIALVNSASIVTALSVFPTELGLAANAGAAPTADGRIAYDTTKDMYVGGQSGTTIELSLYDVAGSVVSKPGVSQICVRFVAPRAFTLPTGTISNGSNANGVKAGTAANAQADFLVRKNGSTFCTLRFAASGTVPTYLNCTATDFAAGDVITVEAPSSPDSTLADIGFSLTGKLK